MTEWRTHFRRRICLRACSARAARITVVTPNCRFQSLTADFDAYRSGQAPSWLKDILLDAFVVRLGKKRHSDLELFSPVRVRRSRRSGRSFQEDSGPAVDQRGRGAVPRSMAAARCPAGASRRRRRRGRSFPRVGEERTRRAPGADRPGAPARRGSRIHRKQKLASNADVIIPPQTRDFPPLRLRNAIPRGGGSAIKLSFPSARQRSTAATWALRASRKARASAWWSRSREAQAMELRAFSRVMQPGYSFPRSRLNSGASTVQRLARQAARGLALVDSPLSLIELSFPEIDFARASRLIRSLFLGGADSEIRATSGSMQICARRWERRSRPPASLSPSVTHCPQRQSTFGGLFFSLRAKVARRPSPGRHFSALLEAAGFPGERATRRIAGVPARARWPRRSASSRTSSDRS